MAELANQPSHHGGLPTSCWRLPIFVSRLCQTRRSPCLPPCHATFRHSRLPRNLACGSIFFVKIRNGHRRASIGQNLPRARSPPVLESRLCCFATEAMQNCTRFGSFENPSILLSGLRVARRPVSDRAPVHVDVDEKVHEPTKLAAVFDTLVSQGFAA